MKVMRRSRWLARLAAVLVVGVVAAAAPAQAGIVFQSHVVASWGFNNGGDLGDGTTTDRSLYGDIKVANDVVQVAAGYYFGLAPHALRQVLVRRSRAPSTGWTGCR